MADKNCVTIPFFHFHSVRREMEYHLARLEGITSYERKQQR